MFNKVNHILNTFKYEWTIKYHYFLKNIYYEK